MDKTNEPNPHQVDLCTRWLKQFARPRKSVNHKVSSATYKVAVEKWSKEYVTSDAFIAAAKAEGYTAVSNHFAPSVVCFNFSVPRRGTPEHTAAGMR